MKKKKILKSLGTVIVTLSGVLKTRKVFTEDKFVLGDNFKEWFLSDDGKIEYAAGRVKLRRQKIIEASVDDQIIPECGGRRKAKTSLAVVFALVRRQSTGQKGVLLTNEFGNIFYCLDLEGILRAVVLSRRGGSWHVYSHSVESPSGWRVGCQVISRK